MQICKRAFVFLALILGMFVLLTGCRWHTPDPPEPAPADEIGSGIRIEIDGVVLWNGPSEGGELPALAPGSHTLTVENQDSVDFDMDFIFSVDLVDLPESFADCSGTRELSLTLSVGEHREIPFGISITPDGQEEAYLDSFILNADRFGRRAYPLTADGFRDCALVRSESTVCPRGNLYFEGDLELTHPLELRLETAAFTVSGELLLRTEQSGNYVLTEASDGLLSVGDLFAEAPNCHLVLPKSLERVLAAPTYYLRALSLNGTALVQGERQIGSNDDFERLLDVDRRPNIVAGDTLRFSGDYTLEGGLTFEYPLSFAFENGVTLKSPFHLNTDASATVTLTADDAELPRFPLLMNAPNCDLIWKGGSATLVEIYKTINVRTVNGRESVDYRLGGDGKAKLRSVRLLRSDNENLTEDIEWTLDGYTLSASISCVLDPELLHAAKMEIVTDGGRVVLDGATSTDGSHIDLTDPLGAYFTLTDADGKICRYAIYTEYVPTKLPVVLIYTEGGQTVDSKEEYIGATVAIRGDAEGRFDSLEESSAWIKGRGNSTWKWDKKPYKIKFDSKASVLGLPKAKKWVLLANYVDFSLIRNSVALRAAAFLDGMTYAPTQYPVDVFVNGSYQGVYTIGEQIEAKPGRVELTDNGTELDTGYLLEVGGTSSGDVWNVNCFQTELMKYVKIHAPDDEGTLTAEQVAYIKDYVAKADAAIIAGEGYEEYIDLDALIDWLILHEITYNVDSSFRRSCFLTKDAGGKLTMGPAWDFDLSLGNFNRCPADGKGWACLMKSSDDYLWTNWMTYLYRDEYFMSRMKARWDSIKDELLEFMLEQIDELSALIAPSAKYNFEVWQLLGTRHKYQPSLMRKYKTYEAQVEYVRTYLKLRWSWMDDNMKVVEDE